MKLIFKKSFAVIMSLVMCASMFFGVQLTSFAAESDVNYVTDGDYIYNWGQRETDATFLSPKAKEFYQKNNIIYSALSALSGSSDVTQVPDSALYEALYQTMSSKHSTMTSYGDTRYLYKYTDCENSNTAEISLFYSGSNVSSTWDGSTYTREHTWPDSKGTGTSDVTNSTTSRETDIIMLRPVTQSNNSSRGNKPYGNSGSTTYFYPNSKTDTYDVRGDVARAVLYVYVRYGNDDKYADGAIDYMWGEGGVIESKEVLLEWMAADPVDTWEMGRNDSTEAITGTRNIFIDYPELAFELFEENIPESYVSPSGGADVEGITDAAGAQITFEFGENGTASHSDGSSASTYTETVDNYTLTLENISGVYKNARDAKGNSALKLGTASKAGSFSFTVPDDVTSVIIKAAQYKTNTTKISVNDTAYTISTEYASNDGSYTDITVDTTTNKTINFTTVSGGYRCMIDSITYVISGSSGGETPDPEVPTDPTPDTPEDPDGTPVEATISFASTTQRVSQDTNSQVWTNDGLTFTNDKASSTTSVSNYSNPVRIYANSKVSLTLENALINKVVFAADSSSYATALETSINNNNDSNLTVSTSGSTVTVEFTTAVESFVINKISSQTRLDQVTVYGTLLSGGSEDTVTITAQSNNVAYGTVEVSGKYITATPANGYEVSGYEIIDGNAEVTQNGNNFTVETTENVTIQINFVPRQQYTVNFSEQGIIENSVTVYSGDKITLPQITASEYSAAGWIETEIDGETTTAPDIYKAGNEYTVTGNITFYALYSRTETGGSGESNLFTKHTGTITEGDYVIVYDGYAMKSEISSDRFTQSQVTVTSDSINTPAGDLIWHISQYGDYWTLYNESISKYASGTGNKNQGKLVTATDDFALWTVSGTSAYEFVNKGNDAKSVNANLRRNGTYGFACYATSTGGALSLYKRTDAAITTIYFTNPTQAVFKVTAQSNNAEYGTVSVSGTTVSATPNEGYTIAGYEITSGTAQVTQEGATFFLTPSSDVEITIIFEPLPIYTVTFVENGVTVGSESKYSNGQITLPDHSGELDANTTFDGWATTENETDTTKILKAGSKYAVTNDVTLYAQYTVTVIETADHNFVKVTENLEDFTGTYLIVYEAGNKALNGAVNEKTDATNNGIDVQITDGKIAALDKNMAATVLIEKIDGGYTMRTKSGLYFGSESDTNSMLSNPTKTYVNTISVDADGNAVITGEGGAILRYNAASNQNRFRFYASDSYTGQKAIALYKLDVADVKGAQVSIGSDLSVYYHVSLQNPTSQELDNLKMHFTIGEDTPVVVDLENSGEYYYFAFEGISPQRMGDLIKAELFFDENLIDVVGQYSIKQNAINLLNSTDTTDAQKQFITDMLYYGAAAQNYSGYNKNNLVTDGIDGLGEPSDKQLTEDYNQFKLTQTIGDAGFKSATVWFDAVNRLIVKVSKKTADVNVKVFVTADGVTKTELTYNSSVGGYMTDDIKVTDFDKAYTFELCDQNDDVIQTLTYSVNSYAYSKQNSANSAMVDLALALFRLGQSAENL